MIKHGPEKRSFLKDLIPCLHFSKNFKNLENLGGVKLKHLLEIQNTWRGEDQFSKFGTLSSGTLKSQNNEFTAKRRDVQLD